eukprot:1144358-Pelagomonas_calceolata.AAC.1
MGIRRVTSSSPCLILAMRVERSLLESASGANKFISALNRMPFCSVSMKLQSKPGSCMSVKTPCPLPPNIPDIDVAQWLWNYKQNKAAELSPVQASNTIFRYDHVIQNILGWHHIRKSKKSSQEKQQIQYK